ncbi:hypothetical protein QE152_g19600 [Popillia japonica]|uniref:Uncharacterized protein n=1 Tax=Popillia japonica TaxID=7064 RepID=A0AAW1KQT4_POPJA
MLIKVLILVEAISVEFFVSGREERFANYRFPNRHIANKSVFSATYRRPSEHGTVHTVQGTGRVEVNHEDTEQVLERFEADPTLSIRKVVNDLSISQWKIVARRHDLKLIVTSATMDSSKFSMFFARTLLTIM